MDNHQPRIRRSMRVSSDGVLSYGARSVRSFFGISSKYQHQWQSFFTVTAADFNEKTKVYD